MTKRALSLAALVAASAIALSGCSAGDSGSASGSDAGGVLKIAALEGGYGADMYDEVAAAYEKLNPGVDVQVQTSKSIEDELTPNMQAGDYPDLVVLGQGRQAGLTETLIKDKALEDVSDVLTTTIPGEDVTVGDKLVDGIVGNLNTDPYGDGKTYLMPMYYSPTGLFYDTALLEEKGWAVPTTWDELFALGDQAKAEGLSLFTYPTAGYLDGYFFSLLADVGGEDFYTDVMTYKEDVWETDEAREALELTAKLLSYAAPTTVGYANQQDFTKNQQSILDGSTLFMPNGTWIVGEMADAPRTDGFAWGLTPLPAVEAGGDRYITTSVESAWIPSAAENKDTAKDFMAFLYSDEAAQIFAASNAIQPITGLADSLDGDTKQFYSVYSDAGVKALVGGFASTAPVEGVDIKTTLLDSANSIISGDLSVDEWQSELNEASNRLGAAS
ncbi:carbohydrate ABC transporter substrate-binding protein [Rathayibacter sp. VKM Ac-2760]|uniref:carbohydrate ABC transporter substrate-binding protein n=1 Tax=Rathayibacter sp. VKM Ac-2760 TaxID=2609253 RepID=UPI001317642C|nr:carbohydrate ABC transporter substrate-binding protein [Rathayibacter sp. VKM Ac-2760]QHC61040.1 carbohydrate ABC transporter substrate-binding protein [Rathayibacter sp. VKM Ac-2760]